MKRPNDNDGDEQKKKPALDNRRNSLAAAIEVESERELVVRECNDGKQQLQFVKNIATSTIVPTFDSMIFCCILKTTEQGTHGFHTNNTVAAARYDDIGNPQQTGQFQHTTNVKPERQQSIGIAHSAIASLGLSFFLLAHLTKKRANV
ncbi:hypothetical protein H257_06727 [Aphanomyces astaci]|uniref:Uncharacterized protein n=1 Tax=Aphanomyces astaci TaxID=112090 RepID=W4GN50_APHAT|nr:hypothetical protein H257_06727 [Aphanomyces astaci]ETV80454.1 hypothetical protein H257_06727 [Aphanomyces astaci]|eukprot:XP_009830378.1 hypothetical protein H257_06727 [Aphanomyces astaci]